MDDMEQRKAALKQVAKFMMPHLGKSPAAVRAFAQVGATAVYGCGITMESAVEMINGIIADVIKEHGTH